MAGIMQGWEKGDASRSIPMPFPLFSLDKLRCVSIYSHWGVAIWLLVEELNCFLESIGGIPDAEKPGCCNIRTYNCFADD